MTPDKCTECDQWERRGAKFCMNCGRKLDDDSYHSDKTYDTVALLCSLFVAIICVVTVVYAILNINALITSLDGYTVSMLGLFYVGGTAREIYMVLIVIADIAVIVYALYTHIAAVRKNNNHDIVRHSGFGAASVVICMVIAFSTTYSLFSLVTGLTIDSSWIDEYTNMQLTFMFMNAGFSEEIQYRVFLIGVPMVLLALLHNMDKRSWQYLFGGFGMTKTALILMLISSLFFGLAHYNGWGAVKVPMTIVVGFAFAYLYVQYGLYACVIAHIANDCLTILTYAGLDALFVIIFFSMIIIGAIAIAMWISNLKMNAGTVRTLEWFPGKIDKNLREQWKR